MQEYLSPTKFIDFENPAIIKFSERFSSDRLSIREKAIAVYYAVRDEIRYDPYHLDLRPEVLSASITLNQGYGYCVEKSLLLCAAGRSLGIPSRLGFSIVRNHLATDKFIKLLGTDVFVFHGYNDFFIEDKWVKCTPAFNKELCEKFSVHPLEFDGIHDSIFHEFDKAGQKHMEYLHNYGNFADLPFELFKSELEKYYPHLFTSGIQQILQRS